MLITVVPGEVDLGLILLDSGGWRGLKLEGVLLSILGLLIPLELIM